MQNVSGFMKFRLKQRWYNVSICFLLILVLYVIGYELRLLQSEITIQRIRSNGINYDTFRNIIINEELIKVSEKKANHVKNKYLKLQQYPYIDAIGYLTFSMIASDFNPVERGLVDEMTFFRGIAEIIDTSDFQELYNYYTEILTGLEYFPVPKLESEEADIYYENSWFFQRTYGGNRRHEGTDLMTTNNQPGFFPIISITDGVVEKMGWLEQGGYRIGIRSKAGGYFYYAHLNSYAPEIKEGDTVIAGQLLGFMGDSGYGKEGTTGQFEVHLHLGIYVDTDTGEMSVNPYWILRMLEDDRTSYHKN